MAGRVAARTPRIEDAVDELLRLGEAIRISGVQRPHGLALSDPDRVDAGVDGRAEKPAKPRGERPGVRGRKRRHAQFVCLGPADGVARHAGHLLRLRRIETPLARERGRAEVQLLSRAAAEQLQREPVAGQLELLGVLAGGLPASNHHRSVRARERGPVAALLALGDQAVPLADGEMIPASAKAGVLVLVHPGRVVPQFDGLRLGRFGARRVEDGAGAAAWGHRELPSDFLEPDLVGVTGERERVRDVGEGLAREDLDACDVTRQRLPLGGPIESLDAHAGGRGPA